jgi:hypothetical protein
MAGNGYVELEVCSSIETRATTTVILGSRVSMLRLRVRYRSIEHWSHPTQLRGNFEESLSLHIVKSTGHPCHGGAMAK